MKALFSVAMVLIGALFSSAHASWEMPCVSEVIDNTGGRIFRESERNCLYQNENFQKSLESLCSASQMRLSDKYSRYREFEIAYKQADQNLAAETSHVLRLQFANELIRIRDEWNIFGFRDEIAGALNLVTYARLQCLPKNQ